ncbi:hypothetical protein GCM10007036_10060 [Alsobacter metallidurans]|uniref:DUF4239 domain-containing protein n=1 Tax=Alsobacter metallidurans TaxID=340221 RepID=A0A917I4M8_9HYPH|nr:DUF4239 domain-containing protein [Alsobacter metallidurans]GGH12324.1 hypothetical protein GCM10007036_10060 [Alsobacter metallidurans]
MAGWLDRFVSSQSDPVLLLSGVVGMAGLAVLVALAVRRILRRVDPAVLEGQSKLAEAVHGGLLAFAIFVLALVLTDVRANFGRADDAALREASVLARLDRDLARAADSPAAPQAAEARAALKRYGRAVAEFEWKALAEPAPRLSEEAGQRLAELVAAVRRLPPGEAAGLAGLLDKAEELRQGRLESATKSVPALFWEVIALFLFGAMVMNGRHTLDRFGLGLICLHMGAIGMVVALILAMDSPFRGETSVSPAAIVRAVGEG